MWTRLTQTILLHNDEAKVSKAGAAGWEPEQGIFPKDTNHKKKHDGVNVL